MKYFFSFILLLTVGITCKPRIISGKELEDQLKQTMKNYLDTTLAHGTEIVIKDLEYYVDKEYKQYDCSFTVRVKNANMDTTGIMTANISNDFTKVKRIR